MKPLVLDPFSKVELSRRQTSATGRRFFACNQHNPALCKTGIHLLFKSYFLRKSSLP